MRATPTAQYSCTSLACPAWMEVDLLRNLSGVRGRATWTKGAGPWCMSERDDHAVEIQANSTCFLDWIQLADDRRHTYGPVLMAYSGKSREQSFALTDTQISTPSSSSLVTSLHTRSNVLSQPPESYHRSTSQSLVLRGRVR